MNRVEGRRSTTSPRAGTRPTQRTSPLVLCLLVGLASTWSLARSRGDGATDHPAPPTTPAPAPPAPLVEPAGSDALARIEVAPSTEPATTALARDLVPPGKLANVPADRAATIAAALDHHAAKTRDRARAMDQKTLQGQITWLEASRAAGIHAAAAEVVRQGSAWPFLTEDAESRRAARRLLPRGWESFTMIQAAQSSDGRSIDLLIPIDPAAFPEPGTLLEHMRAVRQVLDFNTLSEEKRRELLERNFAAVRAWLEAEDTKLLPLEVEIDLSTWMLRLR